MVFDQTLDAVFPEDLLWSNWTYDSIGVVIYLELNRQQAIISTTDSIVQWHIYTSPNFDE